MSVSFLPRPLLWLRASMAWRVKVFRRRSRSHFPLRTCLLRVVWEGKPRRCAEAAVTTCFQGHVLDPVRWPRIMPLFVPFGVPFRLRRSCCSGLLLGMLLPAKVASVAMGL